MPTALLNLANYAEQSKKEDYLRLCWFLQHKDEFEKNKKAEKTQLDEIKTHMVDKQGQKTPEDLKESDVVEAVEVEDAAAAPADSNKYVGQSSRIMRPVLIDVDDLIYKKGRVAYLKKRSELLPDKRYFYKETSGFEYGWKMWDCAKTMEMKRYGKSAVLRQTFYRRRAGIEKDPDWYRSPLRLSPTICNA